jgi:hypothetical protein
MLPDLDGYAQAVAVSIAKVDPQVADRVFHRTATHSLLFAMVLAVLFWLASKVKNSPYIANFGYGLATGVAILHGLPDVLAWFDGVGVLWPFFSVNLWGWVQLSDTAENLLHAGNFIAFGLYFGYLMSLARQSGTCASYLPRLHIYTWIQLSLGALFVVLALTLPLKTYSVLDGAVLLLFAFPNALWVTWRAQEAIEAI